MNRLALGALLLVGAALSAACDEHSARNGILASTAATPQLTQSYAMPVHVTATAGASGCDNSPGPYITLNGQLALGGLGSRFTFTNNQKGTHTYSEDHKVDVTVVPAGDAITIPKQPVQGGVGGNPFIWVQLVDGADAPLTSEMQQQPRPLHHPGRRARPQAGREGEAHLPQQRQPGGWPA